MLAAIHKHLFDEIYDFAGKVRTVNIAKWNYYEGYTTYKAQEL